MFLILCLLISVFITIFIQADHLGGAKVVANPVEQKASAPIRLAHTSVANQNYRKQEEKVPSKGWLTFIFALGEI
jgi:hypothetical protein